jgi:hypothetical protein
MRRKTGRTAEQKRLRRHLGKAGAWCALCGVRTGIGATAVEWLDAPWHPERGSILFVLCPLCSKTNYTEQLNQLHRQTWEARQAGQGRT